MCHTVLKRRLSVIQLTVLALHVLQQGEKISMDRHILWLRLKCFKNILSGLRQCVYYVINKYSTKDESFQSTSTGVRLLLTYG